MYFYCATVETPTTLCNIRVLYSRLLEALFSGHVFCSKREVFLVEFGFVQVVPALRIPL